MNWKRALLGGLLAEVLVIVLIAPVALAVGLDTLADPAHIPPAIGCSEVLGGLTGGVVAARRHAGQAGPVVA